MAAIEASSPQPEGPSDLLQEALQYHAVAPAGKLKMVPTKPCATAHDLALAYSPGVAEPCREIAKDPDAGWKYTGRGNLVAVISNGTAVLGLGNIGALAGKPVMEGKSILFQRFAGVNSIDLEIAEENAQKVRQLPSAVARGLQAGRARHPFNTQLIDIIRPLEPSFGGINLEDIKAPECFIVEEALKEQMNIPVFHDDQHGTAIVTGAALLNGARLQGKELAALHVVCIGAGASAIACMTLWIELGVKKENITMLDSAGVIREGRTAGRMNEYKARFARPADDARVTLLDALKGADVVIGLSSGGSIPEEGILSMAEKPIIFALANPDPEIAYERAKELTNGTAVVATGRSDHPNQVNNVLAFPFLFRGALAVRARGITETMKVATAKAIAELARTPVPADVKEAYGGADMQFGADYILPKPFDRRLLPWVASRVARIACEEGTAQAPITDFDAFEAELEQQAQYLATAFKA